MSLLNGNKFGAHQARTKIADEQGFSLILHEKNISIANGFAPRLVHGDNILIIREADREKYRGIGIIDEGNIVCDAVITDCLYFPLVPPSADCYSVVIWNRVRVLAAAIHSGRTGTMRNIIGKAFGQMQTEFVCYPADCEAFIFPGICKECYLLEYIPPEITAEYMAYTDEALRGLVSLDMKSIIVHQLREAGIRKISFPEGEDACTCHSQVPGGNEEPLFFSNYRYGKKTLGCDRPGNNALFLEIVR